MTFVCEKHRNGKGCCYVALRVASVCVQRILMRSLRGLRPTSSRLKAAGACTKANNSQEFLGKFTAALPGAVRPARRWITAGAECKRVSMFPHIRNDDDGRNSERGALVVALLRLSSRARGIHGREWANERAAIYTAAALREYSMNHNECGVIRNLLSGITRILRRGHRC